MPYVFALNPQMLMINVHILELVQIVITSCLGMWVISMAVVGHWRAKLNALERLLAVRGVAEGKCMLILGLAGRDRVVKAARHEALGIAKGHGGVHVGSTFGKQWHKSRFRTPYLRNTLWEAGYALDTLETATSWANVAAMVEAIEVALRPGLEHAGERVHVFTHLSHLYPYGSSIYTTYLYRIAPDPDETLRRWQVLKAAATEAIIAHGGTISHQHGVGSDHLAYLQHEKGSLGMQTIRRLAECFDPEHIMNPGKLIE